MRDNQNNNQGQVRKEKKKRKVGETAIQKQTKKYETKTKKNK